MQSSPLTFQLVALLVEASGGHICSFASLKREYLQMVDSEGCIVNISSAAVARCQKTLQLQYRKKNFNIRSFYLHANIVGALQMYFYTSNFICLHL